MQFQNSVILLAITSVLTGCTGSQSSIIAEQRADQENSMQQTPIVEEAITPEPEKPKKIRRPKVLPTDQPTATPGAQEAPVTTNQPAAVIPDTSSTWQPNEAHLARGGELILGLQHDMGKQPSVNDMQSRLQTHMGLSSAQAQKLITTLGLR